ncbi:hypothetical protein LPJ78_004667 [Coemansia sp. RSA 989]|nr:actin family [Coemansia mojavensis]KAJ1748102.1 hypothetical protein LPJ79_004788 [Coemansia sp. RSA 1821]KAJ1862517.1 hypothetical protein LPJ78_004667 [Coemansia sp. RSA 989]KAJ1870116.1 hypothetical protein LPJ55_004894 [Coemansia sp. RSA 990]KAJ2629088.1 hypothetical protein H4R22_003525 [Coemansia sp. RSA 1290]KAJ2649541.1 hypothetical protein IWW40_003039 [Coemansia sp. RSA 1250]KAJ2668059.1 hypothetical protein IWW42_005491 [Coemansia sp. RSA 1085]
MVSLQREENFVIIELGSHTTKAMQDVSDVNKLPTVHIRSRAGIVKQEETDNAEHAPEANGDSMSIDETNTEGQAAAEQTNATSRDKPADSSDQDPAGPNYVFGSALDSADGDTLEAVVDVFKNGFVNDWDVLSAFLRHIVTKELGLHIIRNTSGFLFSIPALWPKTDLENLTQIAFEDLNAPSIMVVEQSLMAAYGNNGLTGTVIDMGHDTVTITPIVDSAVQTHSIAQSTVAGAVVTRHLQQLLQADDELCAQFTDKQVPLVFAEALKESGKCRLQLLPDRADDAEERQEFEYDGKTYKIKQETLLQAPEIMMQPTQEAQMPLAALVRQAVLGCDLDKRAALWENIHIVGGSSRFGDLQERLQMELESTVLPASNIFALSQTRDTQFHSIPEYFIGWGGYGHWAAFLGACLAAKVALADGRHFVSRSDYNDSGPSIIHTKAF